MITARKCATLAPRLYGFGFQCWIKSSFHRATAGIFEDVDKMLERHTNIEARVLLAHILPSPAAKFPTSQIIYISRVLTCTIVRNSVELEFHVIKTSMCSGSVINTAGRSAVEQGCSTHPFSVPALLVERNLFLNQLSCWKCFDPLCWLFGRISWIGVVVLRLPHQRRIQPTTESQRSCGVGLSPNVQLLGSCLIYQLYFIF